jgi:hypothetical protein
VRSRKLQAAAGNFSRKIKTPAVRHKVPRDNHNLNPETSGSNEKSTIAPRISNFNPSGDTWVRKPRIPPAKRNFSRKSNGQFKTVNWQSKNRRFGRHQQNEVIEKAHQSALRLSGCAIPFLWRVRQCQALLPGFERRSVSLFSDLSPELSPGYFRWRSTVNVRFSIFKGVSYEFTCTRTKRDRYNEQQFCRANAGGFHAEETDSRKESFAIKMPVFARLIVGIVEANATSSCPPLCNMNDIRRRDRCTSAGVCFCGKGQHAGRNG